MKAKDPLDELLAERAIKPTAETNYENLKIRFNPFPKSGASDINSSDFLIEKLEPVNIEIKKKIDEYVVDTLFPKNELDLQNKYMSAVIRGEYGSGKTQLLLYTKFLIQSFSKRKDFHKNPYVIYIDNPGLKLSELIGSIISEIGEETFKKYIWNKIISQINNKEDLKKQLEKYKPGGSSLFKDTQDPFDPQSQVNYKAFLESWLRNITTSKQRKEFQEKLQITISKAVTQAFPRNPVSDYFYDLVIEDIGISKIWEDLTGGNIKNLDKKEFHIIKTIVEIVESQGYTDFYIFVDEFEDITEGRLTKAQVDRYVANLRTLIDKDRTWCALFAMTGTALKKLRSASPALADRISSKIIDIKPLNYESAVKIITSYLNLAREKESDLIQPFDKSGIESLLNKTKGIMRLFLKSSFHMIQRAAEELDNKSTIDSSFVEKNFPVNDLNEDE